MTRRLFSIIASVLVVAVVSGNRTALRWWVRGGRTMPVVAVAVASAMAACDSSPPDAAPPPAAALPLASSLVPRQPSKTATGKYPAMASLIKPQREGDRHACGAGLVSRTHVITAAHCVTDEDGAVEDYTRIRIRIGSDRWRTGGLATTTVAAVDVYPAWDGDDLRPPQREADLALLRLASPVDVAPFPLAERVGIGLPTRVIGWGVEVDDRRPLLPDGQPPRAEVLHEIDGVAAAAPQCAVIAITDGELCVVHDGPVPCQGDSGSPTLQRVDGRWQLVGVTSHGYNEGVRCERTVPRGVYTDLTDPVYRAWITRIACAGTLSAPAPCDPPEGSE